MMTLQRECIICMSNIPETDNRLVCTHNSDFCKECITNCISNNLYTCPTCRAPFNVERQVTINIGELNVTTSTRAERRLAMSNFIIEYFVNLMVLLWSFAILNTLLNIFLDILDLTI